MMERRLPMCKYFCVGPKLVGEPKALVSKLLDQSRIPAQVAAAGQLARAQMAAEEKDGNAVIQALAGADESVLDIANAVGAYEAAEALRRAGGGS
jgi:hypothetical protein